MRRFRKFLSRNDGAIALEFALVAPVMIAMFFGLSELAIVLGAKSNVANLAGTGADLIAQEKAASTSDMTNVFNALSAMLYPYPTTNVQITITSVVDNDTATSGTVAWSCTQGGSVRTTGSTYNFPAAAQGVITPGSGGSVIMAEVSYAYSLPFSVTIPGGTNLSGPFNLSNTFYSKPRKVAQITGPTSCP